MFTCFLFLGDAISIQDEYPVCASLYSCFYKGHCLTEILHSAIVGATDDPVPYMREQEDLAPSRLLLAYKNKRTARAAVTRSVSKTLSKFRQVQSSSWKDY